ncbi:MAG: DUF2867 domain-containing protein [Vulcanimicrobiota bacterium]
MKLLVTGATGYVGGRLVPLLLEAGHQVRLLVRDATRVRGRSWADRVDLCCGDVLNLEKLGPALKDVEAAFYLVHSMGGEGEFQEMDRRAARNFVAAGHGLRHVIYLGGLLPQGLASEHLSSRAEVGEILRAGLPTTEFRAGPIVGSGSASFEMVRYLAERVPFFPAPRGVHNAVQPIGIGDMLRYLVASLERGPQGIIEVGTEPSSFGGMLQDYAAVRGLRRPVWEVPLVKPGFCAVMVGLLTPIPRALAAPLLEGVAHPVVADTRRAREVFPEIVPSDYPACIRKALDRIAAEDVETSWRGAQNRPLESRRVDWAGLYRASCSHYVQAPAAAVFRAFCSLGGDQGYRVWNWAWSLRGWIDQWLGGPGLRRGRRHPHQLLPGEAMDVWRVEEVDPDRRLLLRAEMKLPGRAWLSFEVTPENSGSRLLITALMEPHGMPGWLYWWATYPYHRWGFQKLARVLAREALKYD